MNILKKIRARHEARKFQREIEQARREGAEAAERHTKILRRVEWARAALATAEKAGEDPEKIARLGLAAAAANLELAQSNVENQADVARGTALVERIAKEESAKCR